MPVYWLVRLVGRLKERLLECCLAHVLLPTSSVFRSSFFPPSRSMASLLYSDDFFLVCCSFVLLPFSPQQLALKNPEKRKRRIPFITIKATTDGRKLKERRATKQPQQTLPITITTTVSRPTKTTATIMVKITQNRGISRPKMKIRK